MTGRYFLIERHKDAFAVHKYRDEYTSKSELDINSIPTAN